MTLGTSDVKITPILMGTWQGRSGLSSDIAGAPYPEQALDNALAPQLAEIDAIGRIVTDHLDNSQIM